MDDSSNYYFIHNLQRRGGIATKRFTVTKLDKYLNKKWSLIANGSFANGYHLINANIIDTMLYIVLEAVSPNSSYSYVDIACVNTLSGKISRGIRMDSSNYVRGNLYPTRNGVYHSSQRGITQLNKRLEPIKTVDIKWYDYFALASDYYRDRRNYALDYIISDVSNPNRGNSFSFMDTAMTAIYVIRHPLVTDDHFCKFKINPDRSIDIVAHSSFMDTPYGIRHIHILNDWKTIDKNRFYILPHTTKDYYYNDIHTDISVSGHHGGFLSDSIFYKHEELDNIHTVVAPDTMEHMMIKHLDFSFLPYSQEVCGETFRIDTFPLQQIPNPPIYPIAMSSDSFDINYSFSPWVDTTDIPYLYHDPGALNARFSLPKDTFCGTTISLISDTTLKFGESKWVLRYMDKPYAETLLVKDTHNYTPKYTGWIEITHIHILRGCTDTFRDTIHYSLPYAYSIAKDTLVCSPLALPLRARNGNFHTYLWNTGSTDTTYLAIDTGTYWVRKTGSCGTYTDTIRLHWKTPRITTPVFSLDSLIFCGANLPYTLSSNITGTSYTYTWNPAFINSPNRPLSSFGLYTLSISDGCHTYRDTFRLIAKVVATPPAIPDSVSLCANNYKIYRPSNLSLEEWTGSSWTPKDSISLSKNQRKTFRWIDSCGAITYDSIYDYQRGAFTSLNLPPSTTLCQVYSSYVINNNPSIKQYEFSNSWQINDSIRLHLDWNYIKREDSCGNFVIDSTFGVMLQPQSDLIPDTVHICTQAFPYKLGVHGQFKSYKWSDNSTADSLQISHEGVYRLTVHDSCMYQNDQVYVHEIKSIAENALALDKMEICLSAHTAKIETSLIYPRYIWNQSSKSENYFIADTSYKIVRLAIPRICDTLRDSVQIDWLDLPVPSPVYTIDSSYCDSAIGAVKISISNSNDYLQLLWKNSMDTLPIQFVNNFKANRISLSNLCNAKEYSLPAYFCPMNPVGLPSAFSPNGDNHNDLWKLDGSKGILIHSLIVFNRWGEKVFEANQPNFAWDGTYRGQAAPAGVYSYFIDYEYIPQNIRKEYKGSVTIVK